jgi:hypothetical protein
LFPVHPASPKRHYRQESQQLLVHHSLQEIPEDQPFRHFQLVPVVQGAPLIQSAQENQLAHKDRLDLAELEFFN